MNKKAALNLGISTVVVLVIAMVVIGAGVSFIRTFFGAGTDALIGAFEGVDDLSTPPSRDRPIIIDGTTVRVKQNSNTQVKIGVYNPTSDLASDVRIAPTARCIGGELTDSVESEIIGLEQDIGSSSAGTFIVRFSPHEDMVEGEYICSVGVIGLNLNPIQVSVSITS